jgi:hypothetical protein
MRHHGQFARHATPAPLLAPASRAGRDLNALKLSPAVLERKRNALVKHIASFGEYARGKL